MAVGAETPLLSSLSPSAIQNGSGRAPAQQSLNSNNSTVLQSEQTAELNISSQTVSLISEDSNIQGRGAGNRPADDLLSAQLTASFLDMAREFEESYTDETRVPLNLYNQIKQNIERTLSGEQDNQFDSLT